MKIYKAGNCFNEYHMGKQNESAIKRKKNQKSPFERMVTVSLSIGNEDYKHCQKYTMSYEFEQKCFCFLSVG